MSFVGKYGARKGGFKRSFRLPRSRSVRSRDGATLVELITVMVILSVISVVISRALGQSVASFDYTDKRQEILGQSRTATLRVLKEMGRLKDERCVLVANQTSFSFTDMDDNTITLNWNGTPGGDLNLTKNGNLNGLCSNVDSLAFAYYKSDGTTAVPLVSPSATDIWRAVFILRVKKEGETVLLRTSHFLRSL